MRRVIDQIQQHQGLRRRGVAADAHALRLEFLIARLGDITRELALEPLGSRFGHRHHQQPARIGRQLGIADADVLAEIERRGRPRRISPAQFLEVFFAGFGLVVQPLQGRKRTQLHVPQIVRLGRRVRILFRLDHGSRRRDAAGEIMHEPIIVDAETQQPAVGRELRSRFVLRRARNLAQPPAGNVAHEDVAISGESSPIARRHRIPPARPHPTWPWGRRRDRCRPRCRCDADRQSASRAV